MLDHYGAKFCSPDRTLITGCHHATLTRSDAAASWLFSVHTAEAAILRVKAISLSALPLAIQPPLSLMALHRQDFYNLSPSKWVRSSDGCSNDTPGNRWLCLLYARCCTE